MKKFLAVICALALGAGCMLFAACGGGSTAGSGEFLGLEEGEEFVTDEEIALTFTRPTGNDAQEAWWSETIAAFNEEYEGRIYVDESTVPRGNSREYEQKISIWAGSDSLPDVLYVDGPFISNYANSGVLIPIDNYIYEGYTDGFLEYVNEQNTYNDRLYALSIVDSTVVLFYNKDVLADENVTVPTELEDAWTWDELKATAEELTARVGSRTRYGLQIAGDAGEWLSYVFTPLWEEGVISSDGLTTTGYLNGDAGIDAGVYLRSLVDDGAVYASATSSDFSAESPAASMALMGTQNISEFFELGDEMCDWGVTFYPASEDGSISAPCGGWTLGITNDCSEGKRVAASEFIKYLTSAESCESCARATSSPPSRTALYDTMPEYSDPSNEYYEIFSVIKEQIVTCAQLRPKTVGYEVFSTEMSKAIKDILTSSNYGSRDSIRSRLTTAATTIDASIEQIKIY